MGEAKGKELRKRSSEEFEDFTKRRTKEGDVGSLRHTGTRIMEEEKRLGKLKIVPGGN